MEERKIHFLKEDLREATSREANFDYLFIYLFYITVQVDRPRRGGSEEVPGRREGLQREEGGRFH